MDKKNYTIKDIARMAGVSAGTVDRVMHNRGEVSEATLKKVQKVLKEIDYHPNMFAIGFGSQKRYQIAH
jgi:LacI family transcriptional regulator